MSDEVIAVPIETELDALFGQYVAAEQSPGLVYGLVTGDGLVHARGFGRAGEDGSRPDADTVFPIASMTKSFVACAALIARDQGLISLDDPITRYVPEFRLSPASSEAGEVPTVEMLLSMCGGLTEDNSWVDPFIDLPTDTLLEMVARGARLSRSPGAAYEYSNLGYAMASIAVSRAVGRRLGDFVRDEVLVPLGLTSTSFDDAVPDAVSRAVGYSLDAHGAWTAFAHNSSDAFAGAGGIVSSVTDLARWITWLGAALRPGKPGDEDAVLSGASRRELQRIHVSFPPSVVVDETGGLKVAVGGYGLGLFVDSEVHRGTFVSHPGGLPGFQLYMRWHPDSGHGVVVLTNSHRGDPIALGVQALGRVLARDRTPAVAMTLWAETIARRAEAERLIRAWDDDLAARIFADNVDFDRPLGERRQQIDRLVSEVGPLLAPRGEPSIVSAATPADVTWSIPAERGELICMIHLTPVEPARIQEFVVEAVPADRPRSAAPIDVSPRRSQLGEAFLAPLSNARVRSARP